MKYSGKGFSYVRTMRGETLKT